MTEMEYKSLINESEYEKIEKAYKWDSVKKQVNYYYASKNDCLAKNRITVRVREKDGTYKIQVKRHINKENALHISEESEFPTDGAPYAIDEKTAFEITGFETGELCKIGSLTTLRHSFMWDKDTEICLDKSTYFDCTDYEIEVEYQNEISPELAEELKSLGVDFQTPVKGKYSRFLKRLKEMTNGG